MYSNSCKSAKCGDCWAVINSHEPGVTQPLHSVWDMCCKATVIMYVVTQPWALACSLPHIRPNLLSSFIDYSRVLSKVLSGWQKPWRRQRRNKHASY